MTKRTTAPAMQSTVDWNDLEEFVRDRVQQLLQSVLDEELTEALGRGKSQRRGAVDGAGGYRNGHGKPRKLALRTGTIIVRRPRARGLPVPFESRVLPLFRRYTNALGSMLPELYLHGLSLGDFDMALRGLLGEAAPLSASSIARLKAGWQEEFDVWKAQPITKEVVYLWVDGVYVRAGLEKEKAALLVVIGALRDGTKAVLAVEAGQRESVESWSAVLRDLKARGMNAPKLVIGDGHLGIWGALANVFPDAEEQRCWNHRIMNVLDKLPRKYHRQAKLLLTNIPYAETLQQAERAKRAFEQWARKKGFDAAARLLDHDWDRMITFYRFPKEHWKHIRTTNIIESPFAVVRLRTGAAKRFKRVDNATAVIWKVLMVAESQFRRIHNHHLLELVADGVRFTNGKRSPVDRSAAYGRAAA